MWILENLCLGSLSTAGNPQQRVSYLESKDKRKLAQRGRIPGGRASWSCLIIDHSNKRLATAACLVDPLGVSHERRRRRTPETPQRQRVVVAVQSTHGPRAQRCRVDAAVGWTPCVSAVWRNDSSRLTFSAVLGFIHRLYMPTVSFRSALPLSWLLYLFLFTTVT